MFRIKQTRETALKILYQIDVMGLEDVPTSELIEQNETFFSKLSDKEKNHVFKLVDIARKKKARIDESIESNLIGWKLERLNAIDRNLLRVGIAESFTKSHKAIIIDDVVRIAKKYGDKDSYKIINAVLDKALK